VLDPAALSTPAVDSPPPSHASSMRALYDQYPVVLAPMEDVTDVVFRRLCRKLGAVVAMTEFVNVEGLLRGCRNARRKIQLADDDGFTAVQIYGSNPERLAEAARFAAAARPLFIDINCGCWVPKIAGRGAGAGWLRDPSAMVAMAKMVVSSVPVPVTVKTRIGLGGRAPVDLPGGARAARTRGRDRPAHGGRTYRAVPGAPDRQRRQARRALRSPLHPPPSLRLPARAPRSRVAAPASQWVRFARWMSRHSGFVDVARRSHAGAVRVASGCP